MNNSHYDPLNESVRVNFVLEIRQRNALRELAHDCNQSMSALVRQLIDERLQTKP
jgi:hypothetical protein